MVTATGPQHAFGDIAMRLAERPPETEFDRGTRQFGNLIMETVFFLVLFILLVSIAMHRNALESLLFAVALAVGLTPEFLPMITTVTLSIGAVKMARNKVIVKHLDAIENFGSIDVLCSDKTGTITAGEMELDRALDPFGNPSERALFLGLPQQPIRDRHQEPAGRRDPEAAGGGHRRAIEKTDEIPFDFERRCLSIVVDRTDRHLLVTKGAPEGDDGDQHLARSRRSGASDGRGGTRAMYEVYRQLSIEGFRVLAVGFRHDERKRKPMPCRRTGPDPGGISDLHRSAAG